MKLNIKVEVSRDNISFNSCFIRNCENRVRSAGESQVVGPSSFAFVRKASGSPVSPIEDPG